MPRAALPTPPNLYDKDFVAWTEAQARELRRLADALPPSLDVARLAGGDRGLGHERTRRRDRAAQRQWRLSVDEARDALGDKLTPTLDHDLAREFARLYRQGRRRAVRGLSELDEPAAERLLPVAPPFDLDQILDEAWYPAGPDAPAASRRRPGRRP
jgi:hypothetical protein